MKRFASGILVLAGVILPLSVLAPAPAVAEVSVNINIGPPAVVVQEPPEMVVIPRSLVYWAPGVQVDLFFYNGYWWTPNEGRWFRSRGYNGPWVLMDSRRVPRDVIVVPRDYRNAYAHEHHVPYGQLKKHWRERDLERREHRGEWRSEHREDHREDRREMKEERKEHRKEMRDHGRDDRDRDRDDRERGRGRD